MTLDDGPRNPGLPGERSPMGQRRRSTSRDLERYAALFAERTKVMKSSAMRDLMATTEGLEVVKRCIVEVMAAEGIGGADSEHLLVTTGGQQVIDLVCKTLIDPGDVIVAEAPTYPGAVPAFSAYQAEVVQVETDRDGMRVEELDGLLDRLEAAGKRPKFVYTIPNFQNPAGVTVS